MCVSIRDSHRCAPRGLVLHANYLSIYRTRRGQSARRTHDHPALHETRSAARESRLISFNLQQRELAEGRHFGISRMPQLMCPRICDQCVELHPPDRFCQFRAAKADSCKSNWLRYRERNANMVLRPVMNLGVPSEAYWPLHFLQGFLKMLKISLFHAVENNDFADNIRQKNEIRMY
jgi:hypothetical protein